RWPIAAAARLFQPRAKEAGGMGIRHRPPAPPAPESRPHRDAGADSARLKTTLGFRRCDRRGGAGDHLPMIAVAAEDVEVAAVAQHPAAIAAVEAQPAFGDDQPAFPPRADDLALREEIAARIAA